MDGGGCGSEERERLGARGRDGGGGEGGGREGNIPFSVKPCVWIRTAVLVIRTQHVPVLSVFHLT